MTKESENKYLNFLENVNQEEAQEALRLAGQEAKQKRIRIKDPAEYGQLLDIQAIQAEKMRRSYKEFVKGAWGVIEPQGKFYDNWHISAICDVVQSVIDGDILNIIINIPPRHSKSRLISDLLVPWVWIRDPWMRFLYAAYAEELSLIASRYSRTVLKSKWYQDRWGEEFLITSQRDRSIENDMGGYRRVKSVTGGATGQGGHVIVADDPLKAQDAFSEQIRTFTNDNWWDHTYSNRIEGGDVEKGRRIVVMQRLHDMDLTGHILAKESGYKWYHLCLPLEFDPDRKCILYIDKRKFFEDPRKKKGEVLHPERFGPTAVEGEKAKGSYYWYSQYQQDPVPEGGGIVRADWIMKNLYIEEPRYWYDQCYKLIQSWDLTFSDKNTSDYVVGQLWGQYRNDLYLLDTIRTRMNFPKTVQAIVNMKTAWPKTQQIIIEEKANGQAMIDTLKGKIPGIVAYNPKTKDKTERLSMVSWMFEAGHVHFPDPEIHQFSWIMDTISEITRFPAAPYDDTVDATSQALAKLQLSPINIDSAPTGVGDHRNISNRSWAVGNDAVYSSGLERPWNKNWGAN